MNNRKITATIYEKLERNGAIGIKELYKHIMNRHKGIERFPFFRTIMIMELQGLITVYSIKGKEKTVELIADRYTHS